MYALGVVLARGPCFEGPGTNLITPLLCFTNSRTNSIIPFMASTTKQHPLIFRASEMNMLREDQVQGVAGAVALSVGAYLVGTSKIQVRSFEIYAHTCKRVNVTDCERMVVFRSRGSGQEAAHG